MAHGGEGRKHNYQIQSGYMILALYADKACSCTLACMLQHRFGLETWLADGHFQQVTNNNINNREDMVKQ